MYALLKLTESPSFCPSRHAFVYILMILGCLTASHDALAFNKTIGKGYCSLRHPIESLTSDRAACESQHVVQQQSGGDDVENTIWINTTLHSYLDRSACKPWDSERPTLSVFDTDAMERAYMIGVWASGYHFFIYDHHGDGTSTLTAWDGSTHLLYLITSIADFPQKEIGYFAYQVERLRKGQSTQFIDAIIGVFIDAAEVGIGTIYSAVGIVTGTILHPIDTVRNIPSLVTLTVSAVFNAVWLAIKWLAAVVSFGFVGSC